MARIKLPTVLRPHTEGSAVVEVDGRTVGEVFSALVERYPSLESQLRGDGGLAVFVNVFVDDEDIRYLDGLDTPVGDDSEITILPAVAGG